MELKVGNSYKCMISSQELWPTQAREVVSNDVIGSVVDVIVCNQLQHNDIALATGCGDNSPL